MRKRLRSLFSWSLILSMVVTQMLFTNTAFAANRIKGSDIYQTAINIVKAGWDKSDTAIITRGDEIADALAAAPLAYVKGKAPILFTETGKLPAGVMDELIELGVKKVYIIGGYSAVNAIVENNLIDQFGASNVKRIKGNTRVETALEVAKEAFPNGTKEVVLAGAYANADALSISSIAAVKGMPILLVDGSMTSDVAAYVSGKKVYAVGGTAVLSNSVVNAANAKRIAGDDRYETNDEILDEFETDNSKIYLSSGADIHGAETLACAALAALTNSPIVLVNESGSTADIKERLKGKVTDSTEIVTLGDSSVIPDSVADSLGGIETGSTGKLEVKSVTATNLKQIYIAFNNAVSDAELQRKIEDEANYTIKDSDDENVKNAIESVELESDKKTAVVTLKDKNNSSPLDNQEEYKLVIGDDILGTEKTIKFTAKDVDIPKSTEAKVIGINTIKVLFNEPLRPDKLTGSVPELEKSSFEVNDGKLSIKKVELVGENKEANIVLYSDLEDKQELNVKVKSAAKDYAGYATMAATYNIKVQKDTSSPTVTGYKDATRTKVTLLFNEDIEAVGTINDDDIYHTNKNNEHNSDKLKISGNAMTIEFDEENRLPSGTAYIYIDEDIIQDLWENENARITTQIKVEEDKTKPSVKKIEQGKDSKTIIITFSEDLDEDTAEDRDNYIVKDSHGSEQKVSKAVLTDSDEVTLTMRDELVSGETYKITVQNVEDLEGNENDKYEGSLQIDGTSDNDWSRVSVGLFDEGTEDQRLVVNYGKAMMTGSNSYSVDDIEKYVLYIFPKGTTFPDGRPSKSYEKRLYLEDWTDSDIRAFDGSKKVELSIPFEDSDDNDTADLEDAIDDNKVVRLVIATVADKAGNKMDLAGSGYIKVEEGVNSTIDVKELPVATDLDKIEFTFDGTVDVDEDDIHVYYAKAWKENDSAQAKVPDREIDIYDFDIDEDDDDNTVVTIELDEDLNYDASYTVSGKKRSVLVVIDGNGKSESENGEKLQDNTLIVKDGITPAIAKVNKSKDDNVIAYITTNSKGKKESMIVIEMEELIDGDTLSKTTFDTEDFDVKDIYVTNSSDGTDNNETEGKYIVIKLWEDSGNSNAEVDEGFWIEQDSTFEDISQNEVRRLKTEVYEVH